MGKNKRHLFMAGAFFCLYIKNEADTMKIQDHAYDYRKISECVKITQGFIRVFCDCRIEVYKNCSIAV